MSGNTLFFDREASSLYIESMTIEKRYPCPCCGYQTLTLEPPGTYLICPICFWEDDGDAEAASGDRWGGSNQVSLRQAQRNFIAFGACEPHQLNDVRSPTPNDERDADWQTIDDLAEKRRFELIEKIEVAFNNVVLGNGVSLHQARAIDDYQDPMQARQIDSNVRWQEIPDDWIEQFYDVFAFMDATGFRHAIPAYMIWCLKYNKQDEASFAFTVTYLKCHDYGSQILSCLDTSQTQVIFEFLKFVETFV